ncbi:winged helix-turn-helix transcriptional regulator [Granulicella sp. WH15]|nr:winged helix-turn-helix transcriptional regulator [Granulicella sp. WH15]
MPDCTCYRLRQAARLLSRNYDAFLAECGISIGQFGLLATIAAHQGKSISQIAEALNMDRTTLTRNLIPLQKLEYIASDSGADRRTRSVRLTPEGAKTLKSALPKWQTAQRKFEKQIGLKQVKHLNRDLDSLLETFSH